MVSRTTVVLCLDMMYIVIKISSELGRLRRAWLICTSRHKYVVIETLNYCTSIVSLFLPVWSITSYDKLL